MDAVVLPPFDDVAAVAAAGSIVAKFRHIAIATRKPRDQVVRDLVSGAWEAYERGAWDPTRGQFSTWATTHCGGRLRDMADHANRLKRAAFVQVERIPETAAKEELSESVFGDAQNATATLAAYARIAADCYLARTKSLGRPRGPRPYRRAQIMACLILAADRKDSGRGVILRLQSSPAIREAIGISKPPCQRTINRASSAPWGKPKVVLKLLAKVHEMMAAVDEQ